MSTARSLEFYNPALDPNAGPRGGHPDYQNPLDELCTPTAHAPANCYSSLCVDGKHRPALDIDIPMTVIPSSTEGHQHVIFPTVELTWEQYEKLLEALADVGIVEQGYVRASKARFQTILRLPHVKKAEARF